MIGLLRRGLAVAMATTVLTGCGSLPLQRTYVLGDPPGPALGVRSETGLPVFELKTVSVPDYLDSTDILRRTGSNEVVASPSGRWGERLSLGLTDALASALSRRLPKLVIATAPAGEPTRRILVDVERLEIGAGGRCLMAARWRIAGSDGQAASSRRGTFGETATSADDAAVAAAMTRVVGQLADQIAATIEAASPGQRRRER